MVMEQLLEQFNLVQAICGPSAGISLTHARNIADISSDSGPHTLKPCVCVMIQKVNKMPMRTCKSLSKHLFTSFTPSCQLCRYCQAAQICRPHWINFLFSHNSHHRENHFPQNRPKKGIDHFFLSVFSDCQSSSAHHWVSLALKDPEAVNSVCGVVGSFCITNSM